MYLFSFFFWSGGGGAGTHFEGPLLHVPSFTGIQDS